MVRPWNLISVTTSFVCVLCVHLRWAFLVCNCFLITQLAYDLCPCLNFAKEKDNMVCKILDFLHVTNPFYVYGYNFKSKVLASVSVQNKEKSSRVSLQNKRLKKLTNQK